MLNITVASATASPDTFVIDLTSNLTVQTLNDQCVPVPSEPFWISGSKLIGTPNVVKFSTSSVTGTNGSTTIGNLEWDTYTLTPSDTTEDLLGTIPFSPLSVSPSSSQTFQFILTPAADPSLLVTVEDAATGVGIPNASTTISSGASSGTLLTGRASLSQSNWAGGLYASQSGGLGTSPSGTIIMLTNASGTYTTGTVNWLISNTFDVGGASSTFNNLAWLPKTQPAQTGPQSLYFQVAANNDQATWNFIGPDGFSTSYFTSTPGNPPSSLQATAISVTKLISRHKVRVLHRN